LIELLDEEKVATYKDGDHFKQFKKGGPLEWFNPPSGKDVVASFVFAPHLYMLNKYDGIPPNL
jgi:hypothetical protein